MSCDRGDFEKALAEAIPGLRLSIGNLPEFWKEEVRKRAGALKSLTFTELALSTITPPGEKPMTENGRAAMPVTYRGEQGSMKLTVIVARSAGQWRVLELVIGSKDKSGAAVQDAAKAPPKQ